MERRRREVAGFGRAAEAAAHEAYGKALRVGRDLHLGTSVEVVRFGANLLSGSKLRPTPSTRPGVAVFRPGAPQPAKGSDWLDRSARAVGGDWARKAGNAVGVVRGGVHAVEGIADSSAFLYHLATDGFMKPPGQRASDQLMKGGKALGDYAKAAIADPQVVVRDLHRAGERMQAELDPSATPPASTLPAELRRNFEIGKNQGELTFDVGSAAIGGPLAKAAGKLGSISKTSSVEKYLAQGFSPEVAAHLAKPYKGKGHHFVPRRRGLPEAYSESEFNVLKPEGMTQGDFYELHYKVDPRFNHARLPRGLDMKSWQGKALGLKKYGLPERIWHGSPAPLKARVGGVGGSTGGLLYSDPDDENAQ
ncbi:hypothetical protein BH11PSE1_BH11PSE1_18690 [soil metagenome]